MSPNLRYTNPILFVKSTNLTPIIVNPEVSAIVFACVLALFNVNEVERVIDSAINNGATNIENIQFTLSENKQDKIKNQALEEDLSISTSTIYCNIVYFFII